MDGRFLHRQKGWMDTLWTHDNFHGRPATHKKTGATIEKVRRPGDFCDSEAQAGLLPLALRI